jgi:Fur family ferric uptake transcriptional regulator
MATVDQDWLSHAEATIRRAGLRSGAARERVVAVLSRRACCASAQELVDELRSGPAPVGLASVYRALETLDGLGLVHRLDVGDGTARYEAAHAGGHHHHHVICSLCGAVAQFEDDALERAITALESRLDYSIDAHDVVLRGTCPGCRAAASPSRP